MSTYPELMATFHWDSDMPYQRSLAKLGHYRFGLLDAALRMNLIERYSITSFPIKEDRASGVLGNRNMFLREALFSNKGFRVIIQSGNSVDFEDVPSAALDPLCFAFVKTGRLVVVRATAPMAAMGLVVAQKGGATFNRNVIVKAIEDIKKSPYEYGQVEIAVSVALSADPVAYTMASFYGSEPMVDLQTQGADANGNKLFKRTSQGARPFALNLGQDRLLNVVVLPAKGTLTDGLVLINRNLVLAAGDEMTLPDPDKGFTRANLQKKLEANLMYNGRAFGLRNALTGELIEGMVKAQFAAVPMPDHVDLVITEDNLKHEFYLDGSFGYSFVGLEPQGPKKARLDRQSIVNMPFIASIPEITSWMRADAADALATLKAGEAIGHIDALIEEDIDAEFQWSETDFKRELSWSAHMLAAFGIRYNEVSPWLTRQIGQRWVESMRYPLNVGHVGSNIDAEEANAQRRRALKMWARWERGVRATIPGAVRMQIISNWMGNQILMAFGKQPVDVKPGQLRKVKLINKRFPDFAMICDDEADVFVAVHGGCDWDDFFTVCDVNVAHMEDAPKELVWRNPNFRGEYSLFDTDPSDWVHPDGRRTITRKRWPTRLNVAITSGEFNQLPLPSEEDPNLTAMDDKAAVMEARGELVKMLADNYIPVDAMLAKRLPQDERPMMTTMPSVDDVKGGKATPNQLGGFSHIKYNSQIVIEDYLSKMRDYASHVQTPSYVALIGNNECYPMAVSLLRQIRRLMIRGGGPKQQRRMVDSLLWEFLRHFDGDTSQRHRAVMALWQACATVPAKGSGELSDQTIFGTGITNGFKIKADGTLLGDKEKADYRLRVPLIEAMSYFGLCNRLPAWNQQVQYVVEVDDDGVTSASFHRHDTKQLVRWSGVGPTWDIECGNCGTVYMNTGHVALARFHAAQGICKSCRGNA